MHALSACRAKIHGRTTQNLALNARFGGSPRQYLCSAFFLSDADFEDLPPQSPCSRYFIKKCIYIYVIYMPWYRLVETYSNRVIVDIPKVSVEVCIGVFKGQ